MNKLLIVEDEPLIRAGLKQYFNWANFGIDTILEAENGQEGVNIFTKEQPGLIITDIRMPIMNGLDMIREIRTLDICTSIIILTGYNEFEYAQKAIKYGGIHDFLIKPLQYKESYQAISSCIKKRRAFHNDMDDEIRETNNIITNKEQQLFQQIENFIIENLEYNVSLQVIANHFFYNPSYLSRLFKSTLNINYTDFVRDLKIKVSCNKLRDPNLNMKDVYQKSGFNSYKQFLSAFRRITGMTPTDYRKNLRL